MTGRTERAILRDTLALHGIVDPDSHLETFYTALSTAAHQLRYRMRTAGRTLPGAEDALAALAQERVIQSVVTGNIKSIATTKLEAFNLAEHIDVDVGGYGSDDGIRAVLVQLAWQRAESKYGVTFLGERVVILGDTPHDIAGAHGAGARAVGIATGSSSVDELAAAGADAVLPDLRDTAAVTRAALRA